MAIEYGLHLIKDVLLGPKEPVGLVMHIAPKASRKLKLLLQRPNPNLSEFPFLGLGHVGLIEDIMVVDPNNYSHNSSLHWCGRAVFASSVDRGELQTLFNKLSEEEKMDELLVFGHSHPSGTFQLGDTTFSIPNDDMLLTPSGGSRSEGGVQSKADLAAFSALVEVAPCKVPYVGIAAVTQHGPSLRVYQTDELLKIKWNTQINRVPQRKNFCTRIKYICVDDANDSGEFPLS